MIEDADSDLPLNWDLARLGDLVGLVTSGSRGWARYYTDTGPLFLRIGNLDHLSITLDSKDIRRVQPPNGAEGTRTRVAGGDLLISIMADVGMVAVVPDTIGEAYINQHIALARPLKGVYPPYVAWFISSDHGQEQLKQRQRGATKLGLGLDDIRSVVVPIAPLAEQRRIVAAIETHFTRLDAAIAALRRARANLKRYRAAVLKAAVEGRLTSVQFDGVHCAHDQLVDPSASGQPSHSDLPALPEGWNWATLGTVLEHIQAGKSFKCVERPPRPGEVGVVKVSAVTWGVYDELESKTCQEPSRVDPSLFVRPGDFLFSRANTIDLVGACVIAQRVEQTVMLSDKILRFTLSGISPRWVLICLRGRHGRDEIERLATGNQESMRNIGQDRIRQIRIPVPPADEQEKIVAEVERRLSAVEEMERTVEHGLKRAGRVRQAILKRAFEGKLVPQDQDDEPASVLLSHIQDERSAGVAEPHRRHRTSARAATVAVAPSPNGTAGQLQLWPEKAQP